MPAVLTKASTITCPHLGMVQTTSTEVLRVGGNAVLVQSSIQGKSIVGCPIQPTPSQPNNQPCTTVVSVTMPASAARKLRVKGQPIMLETLEGMTNGIVGVEPQQLAPAIPKQRKLEAI